MEAAYLLRGTGGGAVAVVGDHGGEGGGRRGCDGRGESTSFLHFEGDENVTAEAFSEMMRCPRVHHHRPFYSLKN